MKLKLMMAMIAIALATLTGCTPDPTQPLPPNYVLCVVNGQVKIPCPVR